MNPAVGENAPCWLCIEGLEYSVMPTKDLDGEPERRARRRAKRLAAREAAK